MAEKGETAGFSNPQIKGIMQRGEVRKVKYRGERRVLAEVESEARLAWVLPCPCTWEPLARPSHLNLGQR